VDGTLTDSIEVYYEVFREATARCGIHVERADVLESMATATLIWDRAVPKDIENRDKKIEEISQVVSEIFPKRIEHVCPFPEVESVLKMLKRNGIKIGAFTSSWASVTRPLHTHSLGHYFDVILSSEDGIRTKPAPDGIVECLMRMKIDAGHAVTIGDSIVDIRAGKAAETVTIGVLSGVASRSQLEAESPAFILEGFADLLKLLDPERNTHF